MFSGLRNYANNLQYSERFENNNFAYYNDYQTKADYEGDLTKMFYNCSRKAPPLFVMFHPERHVGPLRKIRLQEEEQIDTMQKLWGRFFQIYHQSNFGDMKQDLEEFKYKHNIRYFPDQILCLQKNNKNSFVDRSKLLMKSFEDLIEFMTAESKKITSILDKMGDDIDPGRVFFYQRWYDVEKLISDQLTKFVERSNIIMNYNPDNAYELVENDQLFQYKWIVEELLDEMTSAEIWPVLVTTIPNVPLLKNLINPLSIALQGFMYRELAITKESGEQRIQPPKIMFINLDGRETPFNIRAIKSIKQSVYYITVFKEPNMDGETEEDFNSNLEYSRILMTELNFAQKQLNLARQHKLLKEDTTEKYFKILAFPLNSEFLKAEYKRHNNNKEFTDFGNSEDILFLFDHAIYNEVREYVPNTIIVSYNGQLNIQEQHFNEIVRNLTIIGDHRVLLFPNLTGMFGQEQNGMEVQEQQEQNQVSHFMKSYMPYKFEEINQERFFNNLAMFAKLTSGAYSLQERTILPEYAKYNMARKYEYFEKLYSLKHFKHFEKFVMKFWKSDELRELLKKQREVLLDINKNENEQYTSMIDKGIQIILTNCFFQFDNAALNVRIQHIFAKTGEETFPAYLQQRKKQLLCQGIFQTKATKVYYEMNNNQKLDKRIKACRFKLEQQENYQLRFQKYTQFFFNERHGFVIVVNHKLKEERHGHLIGSLSGLANKGELELCEPIGIKYPNQGVLEDKDNKILYINYNHCYTNKYLYIFWPEEWNLTELVLCKIMEIEYKPKQVNLVWRFEFFPNNIKNTTFQQISFNPNKSSASLKPRYGCSCYSPKQDLVYIFGGIFSDENDFKQLPCGISKLHIIKTDCYIKNLEKNLAGPRLRAKMHYFIDNKRQNGKEVDKVIILSGGYGRDFTNIYNGFSCHSYEFDISKETLIKIRHPMRTIKLDKPWSTRKAGKFNMIIEDKGGIKTEEKFSNAPKEKFIFEEKPQNISSSQVGEIVAFMDQNYKISEFKTQHRKMYLFGFSRKLKENIYTNYWSAEFYVHDGSKSYRIQIMLETHKNIEDFKIGTYIFPTEDSIISTAINQNKLYILAISPIFTKNLYTLYEGNLNSITQITEKRKINLTSKYIFPQKYKLYLEEKSMYFEDDTIYITGGRCNEYGVRQDVILEKKRQKFYLRVRKIKFGKDTYLEMINPFVIKEDKKIYSYSLNFDDTREKWLLKIESVSSTFSDTQFQVSQFRLFAMDYKQNRRKMILPELVQPRFIKILKYQEFNVEMFQEAMKRLTQAVNTKIKALADDLEDLPTSKREQELKPWKSSKALLTELIKKKSYQISQLQVLYKALRELHKKIKRQEVIEETDQQLQNHIQAVTTMIQKKQIEISCLYDQEISPKDELYRFIVEDLKDNKLVKYFALGKLDSCKLDFIRVVFKKEILICSNQKSDEAIFFNLFEGMYNEFTVVKTNPEFIEEYEAETFEPRTIKTEIYNI